MSKGVNRSPPAGINIVHKVGSVRAPNAPDSNSRSSYPTVKFPESIHHTEEPLTYISEDVDEWFKRCLDDAPGSWCADVPVRITRNDIHTNARWTVWLQKWFAQFHLSPTTAIMEKRS